MSKLERYVLHTGDTPTKPLGITRNTTNLKALLLITGITLLSGCSFDDSSLTDELDTSEDTEVGLDTSEDTEVGLDTSEDTEVGLDTSEDVEVGLDTSEDVEVGLDTSEDTEVGTDTSEDVEVGLDIITVELMNPSSFPGYIQNGRSDIVFDFISSENFSGSGQICLGHYEHDGDLESWIPMTTNTIDSAFFREEELPLEEGGCITLPESTFTAGESNHIELSTVFFSPTSPALASPVVEANIILESSEASIDIVNTSDPFSVMPVLINNPSRVTRYGSRSVSTTLSFEEDTVLDILCFSHDSWINRSRSNQDLELGIDLIKIHNIDFSDSVTINSVVLENHNGEEIEASLLGNVWSFTFLPEFSRGDNCYSFIVSAFSDSGSSSNISYQDITIFGHALDDGDAILNSEVSHVSELSRTLSTL